MKRLAIWERLVTICMNNEYMYIESNVPWPICVLFCFLAVCVGVVEIKISSSTPSTDLPELAKW